MGIEWLWLVLGLLGLGLLWLLIMGMEKLTERLKEHDEAHRIAAKRIAERTAEAEAEFMEKAYEKASAKEFLVNADLSDQSDPDNVAALQEAIDTLSPGELVQSVAQRVFGSPEGFDSITASQSAFDQTAKKVVAPAEGVSPVKVKSSKKPALSKSEQKMLKKIKQGD